MAKTKKRLTDNDRVIAKQTSKTNWFEEGSIWFKEQVEAKKLGIDMDLVRKIDEECKARCKNGMYHLKDICKILDWNFPQDREIRDKLSKLNNKLKTIHGLESEKVLFNGMTTVLIRDKIDESTDIFLTKKEAQKGKKRKKIEKATGEKSIRIAKTTEEKTIARKNRIRIRKEAKKLGITTVEYKELEAKKSKE